MGTGKTTTLKQKMLLLFGSIIVTLIVLELVLRLAGFVVLTVRDRANRIDLENKDEYRVLCVGESTTYSGNRSYSYPKQLQNILNERIPGKIFTVINKGKPGCSTAYIAENIPGWIEKYRPDMIVAMMGINDTSVSHRLNKKSGAPEDFFKNMRVYKLAALLGRNIGLYLEKQGLATPNRPEPNLYLHRGFMGEKYDLFDREEELLAALREHPDDPDAYVRLGNCYLGQDRYKEAAEMFEKALELNPESDEAYVGLARDYLNMQYHNGAKRACRKAIEINPGNDEAWMILGRSCMAKKRYGDAIEALEKAIEINPENDMALASLAWILFWKYKQIDKGKKLAHRAREINPANFMANLTLWNCYEQEGDYQAAIDVCEKAIEVDPYNQRAYVELAYIYRQLGQEDRAAEYLRKDQSRQMNTYNPITFDSYQRLKEITDREGIQLVAVQYPVRSVVPLKKMLEEYDDIIFVDNEAIFKEALHEAEYDDIFKDAFAGDFGHCTAEGNRILADNIVTVLIEEYFQPN